MHIECVKNNGTDYLRIMEGFKYEENGKQKHRRRVVKNIGPLSRYDDGKPGYLGRLRESFAAGEPLIEELAEMASGSAGQKKLRVEFELGEESSYSAPRNVGYYIIDSMYERLGIYDVLAKRKSERGLTMDVNGLAKVLVFGRVMEPGSKIRTWEGRGEYVFEVAKSGRAQEIYDTLSELEASCEAIQRRMNGRIGAMVGRNTEICYYDVTNYWFEIGENDEDTVKLEADGSVAIGSDGKPMVLKKGLRKKGPSKEKRKSPIVQMGLFMDDNGLPISYRLFPGNDTDVTTLRPSMERTIASMKFGRVIVVADGGLNSGKNIAAIVDGKNGYIVSRSTKKSDKATKKWILDEAGYAWNKEGTFKVKSKERKRTVERWDKTKLEITEKIVCFWSKSHYERERHENAKFIEYLDTVIANPDKLKDGQKKIEKYLEKMEVDKSTGEVVETATRLSIDMDKIQEYLDLMGYYTIMTSEVGKADEEIISKYHGLSRIEDSFRITKSDLEGRPVFVNTPAHVNAHFLVCFISLTMIRLIQHKILLFLGKPTNSTEHWESGLSAERIQSALRGWKADPLPGGYFRLTKPSPDLLLIFAALGIACDFSIATTSQLHQLKFSFDRAIFS